MKFKSLKTRVLVWFGTIILLLLLLFSISFYYFLNKSINDNIQTKLHQEALNIKDKILLKTKNQIQLEDNKESFLSYAILKKNILIIKSDNFDLVNLNEYINDSGTFFIINNDDDETINALDILIFDEYKICVYQKNIDNKIEELIDILFILNPILLLLIIVASSKLIDKILFPIQKVTATAKDISINNFSHTISLPQEDNEVKELVDSFNLMIQRLKDGVESLDKFNSDVSHELKTPLTVIRGEIEVTLRKQREPEVYQKSMQTIFYEAQQMQKIVENLLLLTRYSKENIGESFEVCSLDSILLNVIDKFSLQLQEKNLKIWMEQIEPISIDANYLLISLIFSNLLDNAIKYSESGRNIYISLYRNNQVYFKIRDEGIGIANENLFKITDRFYRVDDSRNKTIKGFGLGLSIVKNSVELHGAKIEIQSFLHKGTNITIVFP